MFLVICIHPTQNQDPVHMCHKPRFYPVISQSNTNPIDVSKEGRKKLSEIPKLRKWKGAKKTLSFVLNT
jgi:hypothetical protein